MKTMRKITLVLKALLLVVGMLLSAGGPRQAPAALLENGAVQVANKLDFDLPEWEPLPLEGDEFFQFSRVAWNL
jgi:hypothetical protein